MRLPGILVTAALVLAAASPWAEAAPPDGREWKRLDRVVERAMEKSGTPGLALAVVRDGAVVYSKGYGLLKAGSPEAVTPRSIFEAASLGKPIFATAVVQLAVGGRFTLVEHLFGTKHPALDFHLLNY